MYNVKAAVSRLTFGPKPEEMEVTDIATGHFVFTPVEGEVVSFAPLDEAITGAGYEIEGALIAVSGRVNESRHLETPDGQVFHLTAADEGIEGALLEVGTGAELQVAGTWEVRDGAEVVVVRRIGEDAESGVDGSEEDG